MQGRQALPSRVASSRLWTWYGSVFFSSPVCTDLPL
jgi:hypothetical protein